MEERGLRSVAWYPVAAIVGGFFALMLATASRYGYHRDELYYLEAGQHLAFGYVDQPPLTPLIARAGTALFGATPTGLRVFSGLAMAACVVLVALLARELGGRRRAQVLAAAAAASAAVVMAVGHMFGTTTFDLLAWVAVALLFARLLRTRDVRLWVTLGAVTGVALQNKHLVLFLWGALAVGLVIDRRWDVLRTPWVAVGAGLALLLWLPNLVWQADHGWPQLELAQAIAEDEGAENRVTLLPLQLLLVGLLLVPLWVAGLRWLFGRDGRRWRPLGWAYPVLLLALLVSAGKGYYAGGLLLVLVAAGAVAVEPWLTSRAHRAPAAGAVIVTAAVSALVFLPVVPAGSLASTPIPDINEEAAESVGWSRFVDAVARAWRTIPPPQRRSAVIFTGSYGEAGAVDRFGPARGLPRAYSGHNSYADWGRPPNGAQPVVVVGYEHAADLRHDFAGCVVAARIDNGLDVDNEEQGLPVWRCRAPRRPWNELWPRLRHID